MQRRFLSMSITLLLLFGVSCNEDSDGDQLLQQSNPVTPSAVQALTPVFGERIDLNNLPNYANQQIPGYINEDNTTNNPITDAGATLGRVLFYDKSLSVNNTVSCGSCHKQRLAFGDDLQEVGWDVTVATRLRNLASITTPEIMESLVPLETWALI